MKTDGKQRPKGQRNRGNGFLEPNPVLRTWGKGLLEPGQRVPRTKPSSQNPLPLFRCPQGLCLIEIRQAVACRAIRANSILNQRYPSPLLEYPQMYMLALLRQLCHTCCLLISLLVYVYIYIHIHMYVCVYIYIYIYTHVLYLLLFKCLPPLSTPCLPGTALSIRMLIFQCIFSYIKLV